MTNKVKKPKQERSKFTVDSILEAASRILNGEKKENFTTNKIAEVAGVSIGSLYQYFKNKESIIEDILFKNIQRNISVILDKKRIDGELVVEDFIRVVVIEQFELWQERSNLSKKLMMYAPKVLDPAFIMKNDERLIAFFTNLIEKNNVKDIKEKNIDIALMLSINTIRIAIYNYYLKPDRYDYETLLEETISMVSSYMVAQSG
jgi:AcrR family transcriptional regulator